MYPSKKADLIHNILGDSLVSRGASLAALPSVLGAGVSLDHSPTSRQFLLSRVSRVNTSTFRSSIEKRTSDYIRCAETVLKRKGESATALSDPRECVYSSLSEIGQLSSCQSSVC